jgi:signal transduction histidine kinase
MVQELKETQYQLIRSEKLAATGRLAAGLAHEINNPTSIILNRIDCLLMEAEENGVLPYDVIRDLTVISSYTKKISSIVKDLLIFSRSPSEKYRTVDLRMIIQRIVEVLTKKDKAYHFNLVWKNELPAMKGDEDRLEQVFLNLLDNAMYAMPEGGNIDISLEKSPSNNDFVEVIITDKGKGIPESELSKIFDPFFTTKKIGKGTGLGLSICLSIIKEHNGDIVVESWPGKGSTFKVLLPLKDSKESKDRKSGDDYLYDKVYS